MYILEAGGCWWAWLRWKLSAVPAVDWLPATESPPTRTNPLHLQHFDTLLYPEEQLQRRRRRRQQQQQQLLVTVLVATRVRIADAR